MEKKRPSRKFNFGVNNNVVMSMLKKRIRKRKDHIENLIFGTENYVVMSMWKRVYGKERPYRKFNFGIGNDVVMSM